MRERLYTSHAEIYDALYREKQNYDREVAFIVEQFETKTQTEGNSVLILGCGPGEHAKRLVARGFDVLGVDKYEQMLAIARQKSDAKYQTGTLPDIDIDGSFDLIVLPFTVINHLSPDEIRPAIRTVAQILTDGGVIAFDNGRFPTSDDDTPTPGLGVHATDAGDIARLTQIRPLGNSRVRWNSVVFVQDLGEFFIDSHELTVFEDTEIEAMLHEFGFAVDTHYGYGTDEPNTVFIAY